MNKRCTDLENEVNKLWEEKAKNSVLAKLETSVGKHLEESPKRWADMLGYAVASFVGAGLLFGLQHLLK